MADGVDLALAQAGLDLLAAGSPGLAWAVYDGDVPTDAPRPYWVVYTSVGYPSEDPDNAMDGLSRVREVRWIVHSVGDSAEAVRIGTDRAQARLLDASPTVAGLSCGLIRMEESQPPIPSDILGPRVLEAVQSYRLRATTTS